MVQQKTQLEVSFLVSQLRTALRALYFALSSRFLNPKNP